MHNNKAIWNWAFKMLKGVPMRPNWYFARKKKNAISVLVCSPLPQPTGRGLFNTAKEYVLRPKDWEVIKFTGGPYSRITAATKFSANGITFLTNRAFNGFYRLVGHVDYLLFTRPFYAITMEYAT
jgi:hypothetical protein